MLRGEKKLIVFEKRAANGLLARLARVWMHYVMPCAASKAK